MSSLNFVLSKFDESIVARFLGDIDAPIQGQFIVNVPDGVQLETPVTDYNDLKTKKQAGILALFGDFTDVIFDEFDFDTRIDTGAALHHADVGKYEIRLKPEVAGTSGRMTTTAQPMGFNPSQYQAFWTVYRITRSANAFGGTDQTYVEVPSTDVDVEVSVNGGTNFDPVVFGAGTVPTVAGSSLVIRFTNTNADERYLGYYSVVYRA